MRRFPTACLALLLASGAAPAPAITLEQAMAHPDWIGPPVEAPYWSADGRSIYYRLKRDGTTVRDLHRIDPDAGTDVVIDPAAMAEADGADIAWDRERRRAVFARNGGGHWFVGGVNAEATPRTVTLEAGSFGGGVQRGILITDGGEAHRERSKEQ